MPNTILVGAQWGDEGKGKVIDVLTSQADVVVRFQGGSNAGHTVIAEGEKYVLHLIPSGILHPDKQCVIGNGVVMDPFDLIQEIEGLQARGFDLQGRLAISDRTHMVMRWHRALDAADEARRSQERKIGTTGRGIGPAYGSKMSRVGLRVGEMLSPRFLDQVRSGVEEANTILASRGALTLDVQETVSAYTQAAETLKPTYRGHGGTVNAADRAGKSILMEGAGHNAGYRFRNLSLCDIVQSFGWRCLHGLGAFAAQDRPGGWRDQVLHDARRRGTVPHRIDRRYRRASAPEGWRVRHDHRTSPALRLV